MKGLPWTRRPLIVFFLEDRAEKLEKGETYSDRVCCRAKPLQINNKLHINGARFEFIYSEQKVRLQKVGGLISSLQYLDCQDPKIWLNYSGLFVKKTDRTSAFHTSINNPFADYTSNSSGPKTHWLKSSRPERQTDEWFLISFIDLDPWVISKCKIYTADCSVRNIEGSLQINV